MTPRDAETQPFVAGAASEHDPRDPDAPPADIQPDATAVDAETRLKRKVAKAIIEQELQKNAMILGALGSSSNLSGVFGTSSALSNSGAAFGSGGMGISAGGVGRGGGGIGEGTIGIGGMGMRGAGRGGGGTAAGIGRLSSVSSKRRNRIKVRVRVEAHAATAQDKAPSSDTERAYYTLARRRLSALRYCIERELLKHPKPLSGTLTLEHTRSEDNVTTRALNIQAQPKPLQSAAPCTTRMVQRSFAKAPVPDPVRVKVVLDYDFTPAESKPSPTSPTPKTQDGNSTP